jgi:hypothetical protein
VQQRQAIAEGDRLDVDPVLIDQAVGGERAGEARSAEDDDVLARPAFELGISSSAGRSLTRALLHSTWVSVLENTTFGSAFMSSPVALRELGHACAMS